MGQVVSLTEIGDDIVQITMENREGKNTFSRAHINGIIEVVLPNNEATAYIRVNTSELDREALLQLLSEQGTLGPETNIDDSSNLKTS